MKTLQARGAVILVLVVCTLSSSCAEVTKPTGTSKFDAGVTPASDAGTLASKGWSAAVRVSAGDVNSDPGYAQVAIDASGNAIAVWQEEVPSSVRNAVWSNRFLPATGWGVPATIDNAQGNAIRPQLEMTVHGIAYASFSQSTVNTGGVLNMIVNRFDGVWGTPEIIDSSDLTNAEAPSIAVEPSGSATVVYTQSDGTMGRVWANTSSSLWSTAAIVDGTGPSYAPQVAVDATGQVAVTYLQHIGVFSRSVWASQQMPGGWSPPVLLTPNTGEVLSPVLISADSPDTFLCVWSQLTSGHHTVMSVRISNNFGTVSSPEALSDGNRDAFSPGLSVGAEGDVVVVWHEANAGIYFNHLKALSTEWSGPRPVQPHGAPAGVMPQIGVDGTGNAVAVWLQPSVTSSLALTVWGAHFSGATGVWAMPVELSVTSKSVTNSGSDQLPALAVNANGEAALVWYEQSEDHLTNGIWARVYR